ncbi:MAG: PASTA domain-containing protein [Anaerolineaceae bacterium]|nr:PASTA domain-containing protein [Anaerolineaceae bacterium]
MIKRWYSLLILFILAGMPLAVAAQVVATVPELVGLSLPQAAAQLNRAGLALGAQENVPWTAESGLPQNAVGAQSTAAGSQVAPGSAVDVTVLRSPNALLLYDDNDLTLVNQTGGELNLTGLFFQTVDGASASLAGTRWASSLREGQCVQVWSVGRNGPKGLDECSSIQNWLVTNNAGEHFWTGEGGVTQFNVMQNGVQRAVCPVANPGRCEFYLAGGGAAGDATEYVFFAYTTDRLAIINTSTDQWMPLEGFAVRNNFAPPYGATVNVADPSLFGRNVSPVANAQLLAPGQCIFFTNGSPTQDTPPQPCDVIARLDIGASVIFWGADFDVESLTDDLPHSCPAATAGQLTLCIMPR